MQIYSGDYALVPKLRFGNEMNIVTTYQRPATSDQRPATSAQPKNFSIKNTTTPVTDTYSQIGKVKRDTFLWVSNFPEREK